MGQGFGKLKDRYIHYGECPDQLCGRVVCGLPFNEDLATVTPNFHLDLLEEMNYDFWCDVIGGYSNHPKGIQSTLPFLLASLVYHEDFLRDQLHPDHLIFTSRWITHNPLLDKMRQKVLSGNDMTSAIKVTRVPSYIAAARQVKEQSHRISELKQNLEACKKEYKSELENQFQLLKKDLQQLPLQVTD
jgi:hypothetical protein